MRWVTVAAMAGALAAIGVTGAQAQGYYSRGAMITRYEQDQQQYEQNSRAYEAQQNAWRDRRESYDARARGLSASAARLSTRPGGL